MGSHLVLKPWCFQLVRVRHTAGPWVMVGLGGDWWRFQLVRVRHTAGLLAEVQFWVCVLFLGFQLVRVRHTAGPPIARSYI